MGVSAETFPVLRAFCVEGLARGGQRLHEQRAHLGLEPSADHDHAVLVVTDVEGPADVPLRRLARLGPAVHRAPAAYDALDVGGGARASYGEQPRLGLRRGHAGEGAHLGVRQLPAAEGLGEEWQRPEGARHPHPLAGCTEIETHPPGEPGGAGAEARVPAAAGVELADQVEQARGGGVEVRGQLSNLVAEAIQLCVER